MRLAVFGYQRSGTTMLMDIVTKYFIAAGEIRPDQDLKEIFNTQLSLEIMHHPTGEYSLLHEWTPYIHESSLLTIEQRFDLLRHFSEKGQDYILKMLSVDTRDARILPWLIRNYPIVTISRRDHFDAYLSLLIASHHKQWNYRSWQNKLPIYEKFQVTSGMLHDVTHGFRTYFDKIATIPAIAHVYYEDMITMSSKEVLQHIGIYQSGNDAPETNFVKMIDFRRKVELIDNLGEVEKFYVDTIQPMTE
jgi:hypothetical protein